MRKTALGTDRYLTITSVERGIDAVEAARAEGFRIVGIELAEGAHPIHDLELGDAACLVVGNEDHGISAAVLRACDDVAFLPQLGKVGSLNVATRSIDRAVRSAPSGVERAMSDIEVRAINDAEIADYLRCVGTAFHMGSEVTDERVEFSRTYMNDLSRRFGAFVDGRLCGTTGSFGAELTVPGGRTVPMAAVTQVTVMPTHRRQGLLREMMHTQLRDAVARGEIVAMLIAAEWPIYGRFGYGMAVEAAATVVDAQPRGSAPSGESES